MPWSGKINRDGRTVKVKRLRRKLSALELVGPLALLCGAQDKVRGKPMKVMVDNAGSVAIWRKGYSTSCELSSTLVRAMHVVSVALECRLDIMKITRCSDPGSQMADALSKAEFSKFEEVSRKHPFKINSGMTKVPRALIAWINNPCFDWNLGQRILEEMEETTALLGFNH